MDGLQRKKKKKNRIIFFRYGRADVLIRALT